MLKKEEGKEKVLMPDFSEVKASLEKATKEAPKPNLEAKPKIEIRPPILPKLEPKQKQEKKGFLGGLFGLSKKEKPKIDEIPSINFPQRPRLPEQVLPKTEEKQLRDLFEPEFEEIDIGTPVKTIKTEEPKKNLDLEKHFPIPKEKPKNLEAIKKFQFKKPTAAPLPPPILPPIKPKVRIEEKPIIKAKVKPKIKQKIKKLKKVKIPKKPLKHKEPKIKSLPRIKEKIITPSREINELRKQIDRLDMQLSKSREDIKNLSDQIKTINFPRAPQPQLNIDKLKSDIIREVRFQIPAQPQLNTEKLKRDIINEVRFQIPAQPQLNIDKLKSDIIREVNQTTLKPITPNIDTNRIKSDIIRELNNSNQLELHDLKSSILNIKPDLDSIKRDFSDFSNRVRKMENDIEAMKMELEATVNYLRKLGYTLRDHLTQQNY